MGNCHLIMWSCAMLPENLISQFWDTVAMVLRSRFDLSQREVGTAIARYRAAMERHHVGDMTYHRDAESVAETIACGWKDGFPDPRPEQPVAPIR
jgi:hypothetical protein